MQKGSCGSFLADNFLLAELPLGSAVMLKSRMSR